MIWQVGSPTESLSEKVSFPLAAVTVAGALFVSWLGWQMVEPIASDLGIGSEGVLLFMGAFVALVAYYTLYD